MLNIVLMAIEAAINAALKLDPLLSEKFASLEGKALGFYCDDPEVSVALLIGRECQLLQSIPFDDPTITASLSGDRESWLKLIQASDKAAALINSDLQLRGDSQLFQSINEHVAAIDIDWESEIAKYIGDVPTHLGANAARILTRWVASAKDNLNSRAQDYLTADTSPMLNKQDSDDLYRELRALESKIERLELRSKKLQSP